MMGDEEDTGIQEVVVSDSYEVGKGTSCVEPGAAHDKSIEGEFIPTDPSGTPELAIGKNEQDGSSYASDDGEPLKKTVSLDSLDELIREELMNEGIFDTDETQSSENEGFLGRRTTISNSPIRKQDRPNPLSILLFVLMSICTFTTLYAITSKFFVSGSPKLVPPSNPRPFIRSPHVIDYYRGTVPENITSPQRLNIVYFYAPWSRPSAKFAASFATVAEIFADDPSVQFTAVNCFEAMGDCRTRYQLHTYPVIVAYTGTVRSVYKGAHRTDSLMRWVSRVDRPVVRVDSYEDVELLLSRHHAVVMGYFPTNDNLVSPSYKRFAATSVLMSTGLPEDADFVFAVSVTPLTEFGLNELGEIVFIDRDGVKEFYDEEVVAEKVQHWVHSTLSTVKRPFWLSREPLYPFRNEMFHHLLIDSPLIILVTDGATLYPQRDDYNAFENLATESNRCHMTPTTTGSYAASEDIVGEDNVTEVSSEAGPVFPVHSPNLALKHFEEDQLLCGTLPWKMISVDSKKVRDCCRAQLPIDDMKRFCSVTDGRTFQKNISLGQKNDFGDNCKLPPQLVTDGELEQECCEQLRLHGSFDVPNNLEYKSAMKDIERKQACGRLRIALDQGYKFGLMKGSAVSEKVYTEFRSIECRPKNETLTFAIVDRAEHAHLVTKWGLESELPTLVIVNTSAELFAVLPNATTYDAWFAFVSDFYGNRLADYMVSEEMNNSPHSTSAAPSVVKPEKTRGEGLTLERLTTHNFTKAVNVSGSCSVIFFSGGAWHAPSATSLHVFHTVAYLFYPEYESFIKFYVVDVSRNELPYQYNFEQYPAIIVSSGDHAQNSWKLPDDVHVSGQNLLSFILTYAPPELQWRYAFESCSTPCARMNVRRLSRHASFLRSQIRSLRIIVKESAPPVAYYAEMLLTRRVAQIRCLRSTLSVLRQGRRTQNYSHFSRDDLLSYTLPLPGPSSYEV